VQLPAGIGEELMNEDTSMQNINFLGFREFIEVIRLRESFRTDCLAS
jgi:hypothetical protein